MDLQEWYPGPRQQQQQQQQQQQTQQQHENEKDLKRKGQCHMSESPSGGFSTAVRLSYQVKTLFNGDGNLQRTAAAPCNNL